MLGAAEELVPPSSAGLGGQFVIELVAAFREQRVKPVLGCERTARAARRQDRKRHQGRPRPLGEIIDREREPLGKPDDFRRNVRGLFPRPFAHQREPVAGEHPHIAQAALAGNPRPRPHKRRFVVAMAHRAQCGIGLDGRVDVAVRRAAIDLPGTIGTLRFQDRLRQTRPQRMIFEADKP